MKNIYIILFLTVSSFTFSQVENKQTIIKITQKKCIPKKSYFLVLKKIISDSRCPEGVNCIWAGETDCVISVYENKKFVEDYTISISSKNAKENCDWFSKYYPKTKISSVSVIPYPKDGVIVNAKKYYIKILGN